METGFELAKNEYFIEKIMNKKVMVRLEERAQSNDSFKSGWLVNIWSNRTVTHTINSSGSDTMMLNGSLSLQSILNSLKNITSYEIQKVCDKE